MRLSVKKGALKCINATNLNRNPGERSRGICSAPQLPHECLRSPFLTQTRKGWATLDGRPSGPRRTIGGTFHSSEINRHANLKPAKGLRTA